MKKTVLLNLLFLLFLISCGNDSGNSAENSEKIINTTISGMAQGPFEKGATVSVYELDTNFQQTGYNIETSIKSDKGDFSVKLRDFESQYILFKVEGYYFNIFTNKKIKDKLTLHALTDLSERDKVNINLLTHLANNRTQYLVSEKNVPIKKAKKQAESEVLKAFGIEEDDFNDAEDLDFFGKDKQSAALLAISVLMQGNILDANLNDRLTDFVSDIEKDGTWDNKQIKTEIANWASILSQYSAFDKVKGYIEKWNQTVNFSAFEKYVENFWQQNYNLDSIDFSKTNIKCELDTLNWKDTTEGATRKGDITDIIYIFDNKKWRVATLPEASLGACNEKTVGNFGYADSDYRPNFYICQKDYDKKFYWVYLDAFSYDYICNDSSYYANNKDIHWGGIDPKKCVNCKQENFDYWENICKKQCYKGRFTINALNCATDFDECTESLLGATEEGPTIKSKTEIKDLGDECYRYHSYVTSIDSTNKTTYICRIRYIGYNYETSYIKPHPSYQWDVASDFDLDAIPTICSLDIDGQIVVGKKNTYICEDERLRLATPVEIDAGFACTMYMRDSGNCKGEIISGKSNNKYVCDELGFRDATQEEIETGIACSSCIINSGLSCNTEMEKEFGKTCTELKSIVEKCRANE